MRLIAIKYFNRLTPLVIYHRVSNLHIQETQQPIGTQEEHATAAILKWLGQIVLSCPHASFTSISFSRHPSPAFIHTHTHAHKFSCLFAVLSGGFVLMH